MAILILLIHEHRRSLFLSFHFSLMVFYSFYCRLFLFLKKLFCFLSVIFLELVFEFLFKIIYKYYYLPIFHLFMVMLLSFGCWFLFIVTLLICFWEWFGRFFLHIWWWRLPTLTSLIFLFFIFNDRCFFLLPDCF